jgi:hypothetical protein
MALTKITGLVQGEHDHELAKPRSGALDTADITFNREGKVTYAQVVIEETNDEGKIHFYPVIARGDLAAALANAQWTTVTVFATSERMSNGQWTKPRVIDVTSPEEEELLAGK